MSHRILYVGDMHVVPEELEDAQALLDYALKIALQYKARICFLGDQHHTHSIVRVETLTFWYKNFERFKYHQIPVIALVGNHDLSNSYQSHEHAMVSYQNLITVVDQPYNDPYLPGLFYVPYVANDETFIHICQEKALSPTVVCHQTFLNAQYENGFYAKEGIDLASIPQTQIISGHIHSYFNEGKLLYVGSPRWRNFSDSNLEKFLCLITHREDGTIESLQKFPTDLVCKKILRMTEEEWGQQSSLDPKKQTIQLLLKGTKQQILQKKDFFSQQGFLVKGIIEEEKIQHKVSESEGIKQAFKKYFYRNSKSLATPSSYLFSLIQKRLFTDFEYE